MTIAGRGTEATLAAKLEHVARQDGWVLVNGWLCRDGQGCLQRRSVDRPDRLVLDWWATEHTHCAAAGSLTLDPVDCSTREWSSQG